MPQHFIHTQYSPAKLRELLYPTPYLLMDLDVVEQAYRQFVQLLPGVHVHYAMKCNPDRGILKRLHQVGCNFEIASFAELQELLDIGVNPAAVLFSNPVKMISHIVQASAAGTYRFSFDSVAELDKIAVAAPGASVYVRVATTPANSLVPSEGKFGVTASEAFELMQYAKRVGLVPYGIAFHVGSQMHDPVAWTHAITESGRLMSRLQTAGMPVRMLDIGGGFPAQYDGDPINLRAITTAISSALVGLPYQTEVVIEPGRALVGNAGVMVATVIGLAERKGVRWVHLDVGAFNGMMEALESENQLLFPVQDSRGGRLRRCHITGPSCDSQDTILFDARLSDELAIGDQVYLYTAGAYTTSYASRFNGFDLPKVYYLD